MELLSEAEPERSDGEADASEAESEAQSDSSDGDAEPFEVHPEAETAAVTGSTAEPESIPRSGLGSSDDDDDRWGESLLVVAT